MDGPAYSGISADTVDPKAVLEVCLCHNLRRAARAVTRIYDAALAPTGLTAGQFFILAAAATQAPMPIPVLRDLLAMDRTSLSRTIKPLEEKGLVALSPGAGRRAGQARLTGEGRAVLAEAARCWRETQKDASQRIGAARAGQLITALAAATAQFHQ
jgi:DNA-binding MarR family transcriptional regulator